MSTGNAVVTGIGIVAPVGMGTQEYWRATVNGDCGIRRIERYDPRRYPTRIAGQVPGFEATEHLPSRLIPQTDRVTRLALVASDWALSDAAVETGRYADFEMGVVTSNASGGFEFTHTEVHKLYNRGPRFVSVYESFAWFYAANSGQISIRHGLRGASGVVVGEQAGGLDAIGHARRNVRKGAKLVVTGGVESSFDPWGFTSHLASGKVSTRPDPASAYLPFDTDASGYIPGEGGSILVLECEAAARERGAHRYGRVAGYAATFDPAPDTGRSANLARTIALGLADAGIDAAEVDVVFADAAGTPKSDRAEADAIAEVFGPRGVAVTAPKAGTGRLCSGGGPLDVATALLAMRDSVVPPTPNVREVHHDYAIDLVREPRQAEVRTAVVLARGECGFNSVIVLTRSGDQT